jgi:hypothetical protein
MEEATLNALISIEETLKNIRFISLCTLIIVVIQSIIAPIIYSLVRIALYLADKYPKLRKYILPLLEKPLFGK